MSPTTKKIRNSTMYYDRSEMFPVMFKINGKFFCNNNFNQECSSVPGLPFKYEPVGLDEEETIFPNTELKHGTNKSWIPEVELDLSITAITQTIGQIPSQNIPEVDLSDINLPRFSKKIQNSQNHVKSYWTWFYSFVFIIVGLFTVRIIHTTCLFLPYFGELRVYLSFNNFCIYLFRGQDAMMDHIDKVRNNLVRNISKEYVKQGKELQQKS